jgi:phenylacetate-CoA ligase
LANYEELRARQRAEVSDGLLAHAKRLRWSADRLAQERRRSLRVVLARAIEDAPFHRDRLRGVDPSTFTLDDLRSLPVMTKDELMANFDEALTEPQVTLSLANDHLDHLTSDGYLLDRFRVVLSGGSSGRRGVFVYGWDDWVTFFLGQCRWQTRRPPLPSPAKIATLFARAPVHLSAAIYSFGSDPEHPVAQLPLSLPLAEIVARLNQIQPELLEGYPTALALLVGEARAGRLQIAPKLINSGGELLVGEAREAVRELWGVEIANTWAISEGIFTSTCEHGAMHLPDDLAIIELVDAAGDPVAPGELSAKIYLTNLYNLTQPLIRYEITDSMTVATDRCACGSVHSRITDLGGRFDEVFVYGDGSVVHPIALYGPLEQDRHVVEFQVRQTANGIDVAVATNGPADLSGLRAELRAALVGAQIADPDVTVWAADRLDRLWSGKLRRFIPLASA